MGLLNGLILNMNIDNFIARSLHNAPWHLRAAAIITLGFYILDAWVLFFPIASLVVLLLILPSFLITAILCLFRRCRASALRVMACIGILFLGVVAVVSTSHFRKNLTQRRATKLGEACLAYRGKYRRYPDRLGDLVPEFISSVPTARVGILGENGFRYSSHDGPEPFIYYNCVPPFGNCYYYVESHCWTFLD